MHRQGPPASGWPSGLTQVGGCAAFRAFTARTLSAFREGAYCQRVHVAHLGRARQGLRVRSAWSLLPVIGAADAMSGVVPSGVRSGGPHVRTV